MKPGVYRLLDAPIWPKVPCYELPNQRCGLEKRLVKHGRRPPHCDFWCTLGRGVAQIGVSFLTLASAAADFAFVFVQTPIQQLGNQASDALLDYIHNPLGSQTYAVQPYSGLGRAALYGVSPLIFGYGGRRLHSMIIEHVENVTRHDDDARRRLSVSNDFKSVQVDWTNDAVFYPAYINRGMSRSMFYSEQMPIEYEIGRKALFRVRCVPRFVVQIGVQDAQTCDVQATDWYNGYSGTVMSLRGQVQDGNAECYQHSLNVVSSPRRHSPTHFLSRFFESPPPPMPPPSSPPPSPPRPPNPSPPPSPPIGFTADEMRTKINLIQSKFCGKFRVCLCVFVCVCVSVVGNFSAHLRQTLFTLCRHDRDVLTLPVKWLLVTHSERVHSLQVLHLHNRLLRLHSRNLHQIP